MLQDRVDSNEYSTWSNSFKHSVDFLQDSTRWNDLPPSDLFALAFILLSRYEEYLPFIGDKHGRFTSDSSLLKKSDLLQVPIVDSILLWFSTYVNVKFGVTIELKQLKKTDLTFDIDHLWKYQHKSTIVTFGGYLKDLFKLDFSSITERRKTLKASSLIDSYDLIRWEKYIDFYQTTFFVLMNNRTQYDKGISPSHPAFVSAIQKLVETSDVGIHPGYQTSENLTQMKSQIETFQSIVNAVPIKSRQHYLRLKFPTTYRLLIESGIKEDYSLGYADDIGYRAGTCRPFLWFDLESNAETPLNLLPFAAMDVTLLNYLSLSPSEALSAMKNLINSAAKVEGTCRLIWHNSNPFWEETWAPYLQSFLLFTLTNEDLN